MNNKLFKVPSKLLKLVKNAIKRAGYSEINPSMLARELRLERDKVSKFIKGQPVDKLTFIKICKKLELNWEAIANVTIEQDNVAKLQTLLSDSRSYISEIQEIIEVLETIDPDSTQFSEILLNCQLCVDNLTLDSESIREFVAMYDFYFEL